MPRTYVDDNFGTYRIEDEDDVEFYHSVQRRSRRRKCDGCGRSVKLLPGYGYCDGCATKLERGMDLE
jgi:hypothetical protein